jgi:hypothetical protein
LDLSQFAVEAAGCQRARQCELYLNERRIRIREAEKVLRGSNFPTGFLESIMACVLHVHLTASY